MIAAQVSRPLDGPVNPLQTVAAGTGMLSSISLATPQPAYANDSFKLEHLPTDILEAIDFWADNTPNEAVIKAPRGTTALEGFESITWAEFQRLRDVTAPRLVAEFGLTVPSDLSAPRGDRCITFLVSPTHEVIVPWLTLASMGYSVQFISAVHQPHIVASLIERSGARGILHANMDAIWLEQVVAEINQLSLDRKPKFVELTKQNRLVAMVDRLRSECELWRSTRRQKRLLILLRPLAASTASHDATVQLHQNKPEPCESYDAPVPLFRFATRFCLRAICGAAA